MIQRHVVELYFNKLYCYVLGETEYFIKKVKAGHTTLLAEKPNVSLFKQLVFRKTSSFFRMS